MSEAAPPASKVDFVSATGGRSTKNKIAIICFVVLAAAVCIAMAYWQWNRYESNSGTGQNLGYALQWPAFAGFIIYGYRRFTVLENNPAEVAKLQSRHQITEIPAGILPDRPQVPTAYDETEKLVENDGGYTAYNQVLQRLAIEERENTRDA